ncbi:MAG: DUF2191 domain-containing protein [Deltaproteobacteria bacterium]|nr:DUF2191 domain-containing protein [Deltaproteobacteria bacterium]
MGICMKTTIDITDSLLMEAKKVMARESTTLRALVEESLRETLSRHRAGSTFKLRRAAFRGKGLQPEFRGAQWDSIRAAAYDGHGG